MLTKAGDPCGSSAPEFAPSLLVMWKLFQSSQHKRRTLRKLTLKWQRRRKEDPSRLVVEVALALARLDPRAVQDTFPQPSPRDLKLNFHLIYSILHNNLKYGRLNRENLGALYSRYVAI